MNNKHFRNDITILTSGVVVGVILSLLFNFNKCNNSNHNDEYIKKLELDNIMLDELNKDLLNIIKEINNES